MAVDVVDLAGKAAKAGGATAGLGVGGGLSYAFFNEAHGGDLIMRGDAYGLTAFAFIALFLIIASLVALPAAASDQLRKAMFAVLAVFGLLAVSGFIFKVFVEQKAPPLITINATFDPDLNDLNSRFKLPTDAALQATLLDHRGHALALGYGGQDVMVKVQDGQELTIDLSRLPYALTRAVETRVAAATCPDPANCGAAMPAPEGSDDVGTHQ